MAHWRVLSLVFSLAWCFQAKMRGSVSSSYVCDKHSSSEGNWIPLTIFVSSCSVPCRELCHLARHLALPAECDSWSHHPGTQPIKMRSKMSLKVIVFEFPVDGTYSSSSRLLTPPLMLWGTYWSSQNTSNIASDDITNEKSSNTKFEEYTRIR